MTIKEALGYAVEAGTPIAFIAKNIGKDPTTINKWYHNKNNLSPQTEEQVKQELLRLKAFWDKVDLDSSKK